MENIAFSYSVHYVISLFTALVFFCACSIYFDAWRLDKRNKLVFIRFVGFFFLAFKSAIFSAATDLPWVSVLSEIITIIGLLMIIFSLLGERLSHVIENEKVKSFLVVSALAITLHPILIVLYIFTGVIYWRKAYVSKIIRLKFFAVAFFGFSIAEVLAFLQHLSIDIPFWSRLLLKFNFVWGLQYVIQDISTLILAYSVLQFIKSRPRVKILVAMLTAVFLLFVTVIMTGTVFLQRFLVAETYSDLQEDNRVFQYHLSTEQDRILAYAEVLARDGATQNAILLGDKKVLTNDAEKFFSLHGVGGLTIATASGEVLVHVEDVEKVGNNLPDAYIIKQALQGRPTSTYSYSSGIPVSKLNIEAAAPIVVHRDVDEIIGVVVVSFPVDTTFVDDVKKASELDVTIFGKDQRVATTFFSEDGVTRYVGTLETNDSVLQKVLKDGQELTVKEDIQNRPYYGFYSPLRSADNEIVGMLFVGESQDVVLATVRQALSTVIFVVIVVVLAGLMIPMYFVAKYLEKNLNE